MSRNLSLSILPMLSPLSLLMSLSPRLDNRRTEDTLGLSGLSGLSDVADILGELVRDGGLSPTALGLSHTQAARVSR